MGGQSDFANINRRQFLTTSAAASVPLLAGTAAAQCLRTGQMACDLDTETLIVALRRAGAYLPQSKLSKQMTRNHV